MRKNSKIRLKILNLSFLALILLIQFGQSLTNEDNAPNVIPIYLPKLQDKVDNNSTEFLNSMEEKIKLEQREEIAYYYINYDRLKNTLKQEFDEKFCFCSGQLTSIFQTCKESQEHTKTKIVLNEVSQSLFNKTGIILDKYISHYEILLNASEKNNDFIEKLEEHNSIDYLMKLAISVYPHFSSIEDKYNITAGYEKNPEIAKEVAKIFKEKKTNMVEKLDELNETNYFAEKFKKEVYDKHKANFLKNNDTMNLLNQIKDSEYVLDREAFGQMLFDKISWYLDYNTKRDEEIMQELAMLKLRLASIDLAMKKEVAEMKQMYNEKIAQSQLKKDEAKEFIEDYYTCQGMLEVGEKCNETSRVYNAMLQSLELDNTYYDKIFNIINDIE